MKFNEGDSADTSQVDDRRGSSFGKIGFGAGGLGVVGALVFFAIRMFTGVDITPGPADQAPRQPQAPATSLAGSCQGVTSTTDPAKFVVCVESNVQSFWAHQLGSSGAGYRPAKLVLFSDRTQSGCGVASAATGPFFCPADKKVYLDLGFFQELEKRFGAHGGDFAEAYVIAHEYGHNVQDVLGVNARTRASQGDDPAWQNAFSVRVELQADCYAGVWGHSAYEKGKVDRKEIADALDAAAAVGDDRIQKETRHQVRPETFTHGSSAERQKWFTLGMQTGDPNACDTFRAAAP
jgi:predicted metalloprotease